MFLLPRVSAAVAAGETSLVEAALPGATLFAVPIDASDRVRPASMFVRMAKQALARAIAAVCIRLFEAPNDMVVLVSGVVILDHSFPCSTAQTPTVATKIARSKSHRPTRYMTPTHCTFDFNCISAKCQVSNANTNPRKIAMN